MSLTPACRAATGFVAGYFGGSARSQACCSHAEEGQAQCRLKSGIGVRPEGTLSRGLKQGPECVRDAGDVDSRCRLQSKPASLPSLPFCRCVCFAEPGSSMHYVSPCDWSQHRLTCERAWHSRAAAPPHSEPSLILGVLCSSTVHGHLSRDLTLLAASAQANMRASIASKSCSSSSLRALSARGPRSLHFDTRRGTLLMDTCTAQSEVSPGHVTAASEADVRGQLPAVQQCATEACSASWL